MMELVYDASRTIEGLGLSETQMASLESMHCIDDERRDALLEKLAQIELAIADEKRPLPDLCIDEHFWQQIDAARGAAARGNEREELRLVRERAYDTMDLEQESAFEDESDDERDERRAGNEDLGRGGYDEREEEGGADGPQHEGRKRAAGRKPARRKRRRVAAQDEEEGRDGSSACEEEEEEEPACEGGGEFGRLRRSRRVARKAPGDSPSLPVGLDEESDEGGEGGHVERGKRRIPESDSEEESAPQAARPAAPRASVPNPAALAQAQRIPGDRLPARRQVLVSGMGLAARLAQERRDSDAGVATAMCFVIQELMSRVEQLARSADA
jgi:hypothetical protein